MIIEPITNKHIDPINFERPLSESYWYGKIWNREIPNSLRMSLSGYRAMNRILEPEEIEKASHSVLGFCDLASGVIFVSPPKTHKKQVEQFITCEDNIWGRALEARRIRVHKPLGALSLSTIRIQSAEPLLRDLEAMLKEEDEPDFLHRPTQYAYDLTEQLIKDSYTHYIGSAPVPTIAPDGNGGATVEWRSADGGVVRLIIPARQNGKHYIYTKDLKRSHIDYEVSGLAIAQQLRSVFAN